MASGMEEEEQLFGYQRKLDGLQRTCSLRMEGLRDPRDRARALFEWLWKEKPCRYKRHGPYRLNEVIDFQIHPDAPNVGNCLGLTLLYNCLLRRMGIPAESLYLEEAFGIGPHVLTLLPIGGSSIDVENILPQGFDYRGHLGNPSRTRWGDRELVADICLTRGNECYEQGDFQEALRWYDRALAKNPRYEKALLNRAIVLDRISLTLSSEHSPPPVGVGARKGRSRS